MISQYSLNTSSSNASCFFPDRFIAQPTPLPLSCTFIKEIFQQANYNYSETEPVINWKGKKILSKHKNFNYKNLLKDKPYLNYFEKPSGCGVRFEDFKTCSKPILEVEAKSGRQMFEFKEGTFKASTDFKSYLNARWEAPLLSTLSIKTVGGKTEIYFSTDKIEAAGSCSQALNRVNCLIPLNYKSDLKPWYSFIFPKYFLNFEWVRTNEANNQRKEKHQITFNGVYKHRNIVSQFFVKPIFDFFGIRNHYAKAHWNFDSLGKKITGHVEGRGVKCENPMTCENEIIPGTPVNTFKFQLSPNEIKSILKIITPGFQFLSSFNVDRKLDLNNKCEMITGKFRKFDFFDIIKPSNPSNLVGMPADSLVLDLLGEFLFYDDLYKMMVLQKTSFINFEGFNCKNKQVFELSTKNVPSKFRCDISGERSEKGKKLKGNCKELLPSDFIEE